MTIQPSSLCPPPLHLQLFFIQYLNNPFDLYLSADVIDLIYTWPENYRNSLTYNQEIGINMLHRRLICKVKTRYQYLYVAFKGQQYNSRMWLFKQTLKKPKNRKLKQNKRNKIQQKYLYYKCSNKLAFLMDKLFLLCDFYSNISHIWRIYTFNQLVLLVWASLILT